MMCDACFDDLVVSYLSFCLLFVPYLPLFVFVCLLCVSSMLECNTLSLVCLLYWSLKWSFYLPPGVLGNTSGLDQAARLGRPRPLRR